MKTMRCPKKLHPPWRVMTCEAKTEYAKTCLSCWSDEHPEVAERLRSTEKGNR